jgi:hypothetical protein
MLRYCLGFALLSLVASSMGCAMCASCGDCCYGASGGTHPRADQCTGRVASLFDPADGGIVEGSAAESPEATQPTPAKSPTPAQPSGHRSVMRPHAQADYHR